MIALPSLAGVPPALAPNRNDSLSARYALALAPEGPIARPSARSQMLEHAVLIRSIEAWLERAAAPLEIFRPRVHVAIGVPPVDCACRAKAAAPVTVWLGNANGDVWDSRWALERRWGELERRWRGLAQTALAVLGAAGRCGIPVYTPGAALGMAGHAWWAGELDERFMLEMHGLEREGSDHGVPKRAWLDKLLPRETTGARKIVRDSSLQWSTGELGRAVLELSQATRAAGRRKRYTLHRWVDDLACVGFGATLRWNARDPMPQIFDDFANGLYEGSHVEDAWGWFIAGEPKDLPPLLEELERRFAIARLQEKVLAAIATRSRE